MKSQKGFIQIPALIALVIALLVIGGADYLVSKNSKPTPLPTEQNQNEQPSSTNELSAFDKLKLNGRQGRGAASALKSVYHHMQSLGIAIQHIR